MILHVGQFSTVTAASWIIIATLMEANLPGADLSPPPTQATNALVRELGSGEFQIGDLRLNKPARTIRMPAFVNLLEGNIEYILVTTTGKTHESLLRTAIEPLHIQLAFLLLGAKGSGTNTLPLDPAGTLPGERVNISVSWTNGTVLKTEAAESFVQTSRTAALVQTGPWIFTGSRLREGGFAAQLDGSIVSLITDPDALLNNPRPGREDDDHWLVRTNGLPPVNSTVEIKFRLLP